MEPCSSGSGVIGNSARSDPTAANQLDHFQITVTIPFNSVRWVLLNQITNAK